MTYYRSLRSKVHKFRVHAKNFIFDSFVGGPRNLVLDWRGLRDASRFSKLFPEFAYSEQTLSHNMSKLQPAYSRYVSEVSTWGWAASLEASAFLYTFASIQQSKRIVDLGSGFSSYVLRLCSMNELNGSVVYSVDYSSEWLDKTRSFLTDNDVPSDNMITWSDFRNSDKGKFDLIFHDLGGERGIRYDSLPFVLTLLDENGTIVLDDMHKPGYEATVKREFDKSKLALYSLRSYTKEKASRRYSGLGIRQAGVHRVDQDVEFM